MSELRNVHTTSIYLDGARDILLKLKDDYEISLTPLFDAVYSSKLDPDAKYIIATPCRIPKERKMYGKAILELLIHDRRALESVLFQDAMTLQVTDIKRNKKGEVTEYKLRLK